uniref:Reverse transcriptase Ty1/copia-type domain-containing protein n=1 Tax=Vitis vinifera TaxID=29760 RepID=A5BRY1_VITVI|nr:hypothetical protein VITISV_040400 [Vitis vinifera]
MPEEENDATTHLSVIIQGCLRSRVPTDAEKFIYMGNGNKAPIEAIGLFRLHLEFGCYLDLDETFLSSSRQNLVSISRLDKFGYSWSFGNGKISLFQYSNMIGTNSLVDNLYKLDINVSHINESFHANTPKLPPTHIEELTPIHEEEQQQPQLEVPLRRSTRERGMTILDYYIVYLQEHEFDMGLKDDLISFSQAKQSVDSLKWIEAMKDEMKSMKDNDVWDLVEFLEGTKLISSHYDLELHQMDVKTTFLNGDIEETIYMVQLENFESKESKHLRFDHLEITGYSNSDFASYHDSRRSPSYYVFMLAEAAISWKSVKQSLIATFTMEVESIACYEASN